MEYKEINAKFTKILEDIFSPLGFMEELECNEKKDAIDLLVNFYLVGLMEDLKIMIEREKNIFLSHDYHSRENLLHLIENFRKLIESIFE